MGWTVSVFPIKNEADLYSCMMAESEFSVFGTVSVARELVWGTEFAFLVAYEPVWGVGFTVSSRMCRRFAATWAARRARETDE